MEGLRSLLVADALRQQNKTKANTTCVTQGSRKVFLPMLMTQTPPPPPPTHTQHATAPHTHTTPRNKKKTNSYRIQRNPATVPYWG